MSMSNVLSLFSPPPFLSYSQPNTEKQKKGKSDAKAKNKEEEKALNEELPYTPCLFDLDLEVCQGALVGVAGPVGGGKSSLVSAIMGEVSRGRSVRVWLSAWLWYYE